jgi:hypothetical protein
MVINYDSFRVGQGGQDVSPLVRNLFSAASAAAQPIKASIKRRSKHPDNESALYCQ